MATVGTDLIEIARLEAAATRRARFLERVFTRGEREYCLAKANPWPSFAARFAAKEAAVKALPADFPFAWQEMEVTMVGPKPVLTLSGRMGEEAARRGIGSLQVSLSHTKDHAMAVVIVPGGEGE